MKRGLLFILLISIASATDYYVDFESGDDSNTGTSESSAWKHAPGDSNAGGLADSASLQPGDRIYFKGDVVYRGTFQVASGEADNRIEYIGNEWDGTAIIDGTEIYDFDWEEYDGQIYVADAPEGLSFLDGIYENGQFLWFSQDPEPSDHFFYDHFDEYNVIVHADSSIYQTRTTITDPTYLTQEDAEYWDGAHVAVWRVPNVVVTKEVTGFDPASHTLTHEDLGGDIYDDRDAYYAMLNHIDLIDTPGEYAIVDGRIYLYPRGDIEENVYSISERGTGFKTNYQESFVIQGFIIRGTSFGINTGGNSGGSNCIIRDNEIINLRSNGYYALQVSGDDALIENNKVMFNQRAVGILVSGDNNIVRNNYVEKNSRQGIWFMGARNGIIFNNTVIGPGGAHANGISIYMNSENNLIANNIVKDIGSAITYEQGDGFYFVNNAVFDGGRVNSWGDSTNAMHINNLYTGPLNSGQTTVLANNIIHGGGSGDFRANNIYTDLAWWQDDRDGWSLQNGEVHEPDIDAVYLADGRLFEDSIAVDTGIDPADYLAGFDYDFTDLDGNPQPNIAWDIGPYEYQGCVVVEIDDLWSMIEGWKDGDISLVVLMQTISRWKDGC